MNKFLVAALAFGLGVSPAHAQHQTAICIQSGQSCTPVTTTNPMPASLPATQAPGPATVYHLVSAASMNSTLVSTGPHTLFSIAVNSSSATAGDVRIYDSAGAPTCSSATGIKFNIPVAATGAPAIQISHFGVSFTNGIGFCITGTNSDTDASVATVGINLNLTYQ